DTGTGTLRTGLGNQSVALEAVGGGHAAFTTAAGAKLYDAATDTVVPIGSGVPASKIAVSATTIAMLASEGALGVDGNKDGDQNDNVLVVASVADPGATPKIVPIAGDDIGVTDLCHDGPNDGSACSSAGDCPEGACRGIVVVASNEFSYKNNGEN